MLDMSMKKVKSIHFYIDRIRNMEYNVSIISDLAKPGKRGGAKLLGPVKW